MSAVEGADRKDAYGLSARERTVLLGITQDKTYAKIAEELGLSHETVRVYVRRLRTKLNIRSKIGLALWATRNLKEG